MLWVSMFLVILIVGVNFYTVFNQIKSHAARRDLQRSLTEDLERGKDAKEREKQS